MRQSRLISPENELEPYIQTICVPGGRHLLPAGRSRLDARQTRYSMAGGALGFRERTDLDHVAGPISHARADQPKLIS